MRTTTPRRAGRIAAAGTAVLALGLTGLLAPAESAPTPAAAQPADPAQRVVFIVLDQLRPDFIDAFDMENVQALIAGGTSFPNAYLGHMGSETVVSHNVMTSGQLPKHMGWADEWFNDPDGVLGPKGTQYVTGSMGPGPVRRADQGQGLPEAGRLPQERAPGQHRRHGRREELRGLHHGRAGLGHPAHLQRPQLRLRRRPDHPEHLARPDRPRRADVHLGAVGQRCVPGNPYYVDAANEINYGTLDTSPAWMYPLAGQPRHPRQRPGPPGRRRLGDRRGVRHHGPRDRLERDAPDVRRDRQGRPHVGRAQRRAAVPERRPGPATWRPWRRSPTSRSAG